MPLKPVKVMIVDDRQSFRELLKSFLKPLATEVVECSNGLEAVDRYGEAPPDCVLMDIKMPVMDGLTATKQIKAAFPEARILMLTQYDEPDLRAAAQEAGACGYLVKENLADLSATLAKLWAETVPRPVPESG
jgi:CheY-like chemotaxis protein